MKVPHSIFIYLLFCLGFCNVWAQEAIKLNKNDSILFSEYKQKVAQTINNQTDSALYYINEVEKFSNQRKYTVGLSDVAYLQAHYYKRIQKPDSAIIFFKKSISIAEKANYNRGIAIGHNGLCRTYYLLGDIENSIAAGENSLKYIRKFDDKDNSVLADTQNALAIAYSRQNRMEEAIKHLLVVDSLQKQSPLRADIIAAAYQSLGNIYLELKEYDTAEKFYVKANNEFKKIPGTGEFYYNTTNVYLAQVYYHKKLYSEADALLIKTLAFFKKIKDDRTTAEINKYLGLLNLDQGKLLAAEEYFYDTFNFQKKNDYTLEAAQSALQLGKLNLLKNKPSKANIYLKEALILNKDVKNGIVNQEAHSLISESYAAVGNYAAAYENAKIATHIKDSIQQLQSVEQIMELEGKYQTESRDKEIKLLTAKNKLAQQQKRNQRNLLLAIAVILLTIALFFFFQFRNRQKITIKLRELDKAKSTFFANISHEFRTPLTLINGPIEDQLSSSKISDSERKNLNMALRNTQRLKDLVDQLLALAKLESKNLKLHIQQANLSQFLNAQAEAFAYSFSEKNITYKIHIEKDEIVDWFDRDVIEKIIYNLIGNAIKYTPEQGFVNIKCKRNEGLYKITVQNSGNYITTEEQEKIFERFYKTNTKSSGTGIGLALTKELVQLHHGTIVLTSEKNGFTDFTVQIPTKKEAFAITDIFAATISKTNEANQTEELITIEKTIIVPEDAPILLVVDDNKDIRDYVSTIFENTHQVICAKDGKDGFEKALEIIPDIVISDVMMPVEDGFELTKNLKENQLTSHIPVILLTAKNQVTSKLEAMGIGADAYVTKPFNPQLLRANVDNLIENRRKLQQRFAQEVFLTPKDIAVSSEDEKFLERLQNVLDEHLTNPDFSAESFSTEMAVSRMQLYRKLKALTGQSSTEFIRSQRLRLASTLLKANKISISEVGYTVGFNDPSYFTKCFKQEFGKAPSEYIS